jgi:hypothetical protein
MRHLFKLTASLFGMLAFFLFADGGGDDDTVIDDDDDGDDDKDEPKFTKSDIDAAGTGARKKGEAAAKKAIAEQLGVSVEEAAKIIAANRKAEEDALSDAEKAKLEAETDRQEAAREKREARVERITTKIERALSKAGMDDDLIDDMAPVILSRVGDEAEADDISAEVTKLAKKSPALFGDDGTKTKDDPLSKGRSSKTKGRQKKTEKSSTGIDAGREAARTRFAKDKTPAA